MFEQAFKNIDDILHKDAGCGSELDYVEQTSWILFLKYLEDLERDKATAAQLAGKAYEPIIAKQYTWAVWAVPKGKDGKLDHHTALSGDDLKDFVDQKLFPYLKKFKSDSDSPNNLLVAPSKSLDKNKASIFPQFSIMKNKSSTSALNIFLGLLAAMSAQTVFSADTPTYVTIPDSYIKFPEKGQIIFAGITIEVRDKKDVNIFESNKGRIYRELSNVAKDFSYEKVAIPKDRAEYDAALKKSIQGIVGTGSFSILFNKLEISKMPTPTVKWSTLSDFGEVKYYLDMSSITTQPNSIKAWLLQDYRQPEEINGKTFSSVVSFEEINCSQQRSRTLQYTAYDKKLGTGKIIHETDIPFELKPIENNTILSILRKKIC